MRKMEQRGDETCCFNIKKKNVRKTIILEFPVKLLVNLQDSGFYCRLREKIAADVCLIRPVRRQRERNQTG